MGIASACQGLRGLAQSESNSSWTCLQWLLIPYSWRRNGGFVWPAHRHIPATIWTVENLSFFVVLTIRNNILALLRLLAQSLTSPCAFEALDTLSLSVFVRALREVSSFNNCKSTHGHLDKCSPANPSSSRPSLLTYSVQISSTKTPAPKLSPFRRLPFPSFLG